MKIKIIKNQNIINDVPQEISYNIHMNREFQTTWSSSQNVMNVELFVDELIVLRDELNKIILIK